MSVTKPRLVILLAILVLSSATLEDEQEQVPFCEKFCKSFSEDGEGINQRCLTVCPQTMKKMMMAKELKQEEDDIKVADEDWRTKCHRRCIPYAELKAHRACMYKCYSSMMGEMMKNEAICEQSCTVRQEKPLVIRCIRVCRERTPGAISY